MYDLHSHFSVDLGEGFSIAIGSTQVEEVGPHTSGFLVAAIRLVGP